MSECRYEFAMVVRCNACNKDRITFVSSHEGSRAECEEKILSGLAAVDLVAKKAGPICEPCSEKAKASGVN